MKLIYGVKDKPSFGKVIVFALQQLLAILAATIAVPAIVQNGMSQSAALFGAGIGTLVYLLFTKFKSPVFLGSSFAFIGSMLAAFAGAASAKARLCRSYSRRGVCRSCICCYRNCGKACRRGLGKQAYACRGYRTHGFNNRFVACRQTQ